MNLTRVMRAFRHAEDETTADSRHSLARVAARDAVWGAQWNFNVIFFFFSSRRRHTRCGRDWSSDVCSSDLQRDYENYVKTLENWKKNTGKKKPKLIVLNTSGGGLRSAMWTFRVLQEMDSLSDNDFSKHIQMITGASGGMIGAAYYRDLMLMENDSLISSRLDQEYLENISKDLLNRLTF